MKLLTIFYFLTIFFTAYILPKDSNLVFVQQDSNSVVTETKSVQDTAQTNKNTQDSTLTNLTEQVGIDKIRDLISFEKIIGSLFILLIGFFLLKIITKIQSNIVLL